MAMPCTVANIGIVPYFVITNVNVITSSRSGFRYHPIMAKARTGTAGQASLPIR